MNDGFLRSSLTYFDCIAFSSGFSSTASKSSLSSTFALALIVFLVSIRMMVSFFSLIAVLLK